MPKLISQKNFQNLSTSTLTTTSTNQVALNVSMLISLDLLDTKFKRVVVLVTILQSLLSSMMEQPHFITQNMR